MTIAIIGGSGLNQFSEIDAESIQMDTPFGRHSSGVKRVTLADKLIIFLPRHGAEHEDPPHKVNYRANIWLLKYLGVDRIVAFNVVGGIHPQMTPGSWVVPDQIVDYSWGREHTFFDGLHQATQFIDKHVDHIDFTYPYSVSLRQQLLDFLESADVPHVNFGCYACTQGPRLETASEIIRLKHDGCDVVGMTAMPEAALARELTIKYSSLCLVANWGAGLTKEELSIAEIMCVVDEQMSIAVKFLPQLIHFLDEDH